MRYMLIVATLFLGIGTVGIIGAQPAGGANKGSKLTCTTIRKQCFRGCQKEAPREFCLGYCLDKKQECLQTGNWLGIRRTFRNVIRK